MGSTALSFVLGYLVGSVPVGVIVAWAGGVDIRRYGTGNIGASNVMHNVGLVPGAIVGVTSFLQGLLPAVAAGLLTGSNVALAAAAVGSVVGYGWSFLLSFHGGRAVGTATGALAAISPTGLVPLLAMYALGGVLRQPAPGVLLGLLAFLVFVALQGGTPHGAVLVGAAGVIVAAVLVKRFEGVRDDLREEDGRPASILLGRLLFDRRPGQRLVGPHE